MEDRDTAALYLECTDLPLGAYERDRGRELCRLPGVVGATAWRNVRRGRDDLPRELPEFDHLALYEVDRGFSPPAAAEGVTSLHFVRTPRPGQGALTGRPTTGLSLVLISPREPGGAQALRDWADFVHIRHIAQAAVPGYTMITPYEHASGGDPRFLHLYEMDTDDPEGAFAAMTPLVSERIGPPGSDAWKRWARHPQLRIVYVNTFARVDTIA